MVWGWSWQSLVRDGLILQLTKTCQRWIEIARVRSRKRWIEVAVDKDRSEIDWGCSWQRPVRDGLRLQLTKTGQRWFEFAGDQRFCGFSMFAIHVDFRKMILVQRLKLKFALDVMVKIKFWTFQSSNKLASCTKRLPYLPLFQILARLITSALKDELGPTTTTKQIFAKYQVFKAVWSFIFC